MAGDNMDRKTFVRTLGRIGAGTCLCAAVGGMRGALAGEASAPKGDASPGAPAPGSATKAAEKPRAAEVPSGAQPGDTTAERAAKRMEFVDGWVTRFFAVADQTLDEPTRMRLLEANGKACFAAYAGPPKGQPRPDEFERFAKWIAEKGAARGYTITGRVIGFAYAGSAETGQAAPENVCLCPLVEAQKAGSISKTYCHCSVGYVREMHERMLGRPVQVELVDSVLWGGKRCRFRLTVA